MVCAFVQRLLHCRGKLSIPVPPLVGLLDAYQSSFQIWYASNILRKRRMCKKYLEGKEINRVETLCYA